jgi:hypothetical protein
MTFQTIPKDDDNRDKKRAQEVKSVLRSIWLPGLDSNRALLTPKFRLVLAHPF